MPGDVERVGADELAVDAVARHHVDEPRHASRSL
jgi:hypothetical protein